MSFSAPGSPPPPQGPVPGPYAAQPAPPGHPPYAGAPYAAPGYGGAPAYGGAPYAAAPSPGQPGLPGRPDWTAQPHPAPLRPVEVLRSPQGLATALTVLLSVSAVIDLFSAGASAFGFSLMKDVIAAPDSVSDDSLDQADLLNGLAGILQVLALLSIAAVFIVWFYRVRCNAEIFRRDGFSQSRGWAIGGWFIPFANLVMPYRTAKQIWAASTQLGPDGASRQVSTAPLTAWWLVWVLSQVVSQVFGRVYMNAETPEELRDAFALGIVSDLLTVVAAVLAVLFVRKLTAMQNTYAAQGPYAAV
ncbi:DUF4328 domain-containing protein [Streptomyces sp. NBC_01408]|uniref:DUF4328 domain-containing protein n=1 Tax=Streptomyces sp. NBC_01408 TaxID=2903855 RepID=UPI0022556DF7|nr:DUF4328 domain-containing protein [Streptomyces sp. NBC_01408]MCX4694949.1 DUF4328 domain-containing protein [Streptomyces sp. NBC_01408]